MIVVPSQDLLGDPVYINPKNKKVTLRVLDFWKRSECHRYMDSQGRVYLSLSVALRAIGARLRMK